MMRPTIEVKACPHCGGTGGFVTRMVVWYDCYQDWQEARDDFGAGNMSCLSETNPRCADCGKPVRSLFRARNVAAPAHGEKGAIEKGDAL
jgi:DNA-directed RNA polymerase subunit RPC12/RpoP